jgi:hypothetical protein
VLHPAAVPAQSLRDNLWIADGAVQTIVISGNTVYLGGDFTYVGPPTGGGAGLYYLTDAAAFPYAAIVGTVNTVVPDGIGGFYLGGSFTSVQGQARNNLARIDNQRNVTAWNPNANGVVSALAVSGGVVYIGGNFTTIGGQGRTRIAAVDAGGTVTAWNPGASAAVSALAVSGTTVYAGGIFFSIGGQTRNRIAALDATLNTNNATAWNVNADNTVLSVAAGGSGVYTGGSFANLKGLFRPFFGGFSQSLVGVEDSPAGTPRAELASAPNPFLTQVTLSFTLPQSIDTDVAIYDVAGRLERRLHRGMLVAGPHQLAWDGRNESGQRSEPGLYFVRVRTAAQELSGRILRLR